MECVHYFLYVSALSYDNKYWHSSSFYTKQFKTLYFTEALWLVFNKCDLSGEIITLRMLLLIMKCCFVKGIGLGMRVSKMTKYMFKVPHYRAR